MEQKQKKERWTKEEYEETLKLYVQLSRENIPMYGGTKEIRELAEKWGENARTAASIAMRLQNYRYLATNGAEGLRNVSSECRKFYDEYQEKHPSELPKCNLPRSGKTKRADYDSTVEELSSSTINDVVVKIAVATGDISLIKSDKVDLYASIATLNKYIRATTFSLQDLVEISKAIKSIPNYHDNLLQNTLQDLVSKAQFKKLNMLINLFK